MNIQVWSILFPHFTFFSSFSFSTLHFPSRLINWLCATLMRHKKGGVGEERRWRWGQRLIRRIYQSSVNPSSACGPNLSLECWQRRADWVSVWAISRGSPCIPHSVYVTMSRNGKFHPGSQKRGKRGGGDKEIKDEAGSPGLWSVSADKVDQKGKKTWMRTHSHTHKLLGWCVTYHLLWRFC